MGYSKFKEICDKKGVKISEVVRGTGIAYATISSWKAGKYTPKMDKLQKIADYLGVTLGELTAEWEAATPEEIEAFEKLAHPLPSTSIQSHPLTDQEQELLRIFRDMNREGREKLLSLAKDLSQIYKKDGGQAQTA